MRNQKLRMLRETIPDNNNAKTVIIAPSQFSVSSQRDMQEGDFNKWAIFRSNEKKPFEMKNGIELKRRQNKRNHILKCNARWLTAASAHSHGREGPI